MIIIFAKKIKDFNFILPEGWIKNINMFCHSNLENMLEEVKKIIKLAKEINKNQRLSMTEAVDEALIYPIKEELKSIGINTNKLNVLKNQKVINSHNIDEINIIFKRLNHSDVTKPTKFNGFQLDSLEALKDNLKIYSPKKLMELSKKYSCKNN